MTGWRPVINGMECGCEVMSSDAQATFVTWTRCTEHQSITFKDLKKIVVDENIDSMIASGDITQIEAETMRASLYSAHGISNGL